MFIAGHMESNDLPDNELYHQSLELPIDEQTSLKELKDKNQLGSLGYKNELQFNEKQKDAIIEWISKTLKAQRE